MTGTAALLMSLLAGSFVAFSLPQEPCMDTMPYDGPPPLSPVQVWFNVLAMLAIGVAMPWIIAYLHRTRNVAQLWLLAAMPAVFGLMVALDADPRGLSLWLWIAGVVTWVGCLPGWLEALLPQSGQPSTS